MFNHLITRQKRKPSLTPMIDVVFLLLVFFMLSSRFGIESVIQMPLAGVGQEYKGSPRLLEIYPNALHLNGNKVEQTDLKGELSALMQTSTDMIILRGKTNTTLQRIVDISAYLNSIGFKTLVLIE